MRKLPVAVRKIVGAASLSSFEMNEQIACDSETVKALISLLVSSKRRVSMVACNAVLDLSTTVASTFCFGESYVPKSSASVSLCTGDEANITCYKIEFKEGKLLVLLLDAVIILINTCNIVELERSQGSYVNLSLSF